jgi:Tfp pilus assembly protein PilO
MKLDKESLLWTGLILAGTCGFLALVTRPQAAKLQRASTRLTREKADREASPAMLEAIDRLEGEVKTLSTETASFDAQLPTRDDLGAFLESLARRAEARGLRPQAVEPGKPVRSGGLAALPIGFTVQGSFASVHALIQDIEQMPRLTRVDRFEARMDEEQPESVVAEVDLRIFRRSL